MGMVPAANTAFHATPTAKQVVQTIDDGITTVTKRIVDEGIVGINELSPKLVARATATPKVDEPFLNVG